MCWHRFRLTKYMCLHVSYFLVSTSVSHLGHFIALCSFTCLSTLAIFVIIYYYSHIFPVVRVHHCNYATLVSGR